jgi:hypothetical protein
MEDHMPPCFPESNLSQTLSDPLIRSVMVADGVDPHELEMRLNEIARTLAGRRRERGARGG